MNIVLALHQFFPHFSGGTEQLTLWVARWLRAAGHQVSIACGAPPSRHPGCAPPSPYVFEGFEVTPFTTSLRRSVDQSPVEAEYNNLAVKAQFSDYLRQKKPDLIHFFHLARISGSAVDAAADVGIPVLYTATDFWFECPTYQLLLPDGSTCGGPAPDRMNCLRHLASVHGNSAVRVFARNAPRPLLAAVTLAVTRMNVGKTSPSSYYPSLLKRSDFLHRVLSRVALVLAPTSFLRLRLISFGVTESRIRLQSYGVVRGALVAPGSVHPRDGPLRLGYVGTLQPHKGLHVLLDAVSRLGDPRWTLRIFGASVDHRYDERLRALAKGNAQIDFCGTFPNDRFGEILDTLDALVIPSVWHENSPLVALSAMTHRCPVLAADVPGLAECIRPGRDGFLFPAGNAEALARAIEDLLKDRLPLERVRSEAPLTKDIEDYALELEDLYRGLVDQRGSSG